MDKVQSGDVSIAYKPTDQMWSDVLTKPKQGTAFRQDRAMLMNCDVDYDDETERLPSVLLPKSEGPIDPSTITSILAPSSLLGKDHRSVLDGTDKRHRVTWNTSLNRVDRNNPKVRERHLEVLIAHIMRGQAAAAA
jgi:hypothetical protein